VPKLGAEDYSRLLTIIARLDEALSPDETAEVLRELGLSSDSVTSAQIAPAHDRAQAQDFVAGVRAARLRQAVERLQP